MPADEADACNCLTERPSGRGATRLASVFELSVASTSVSTTARNLAAVATTAADSACLADAGLGTQEGVKSAMLRATRGVLS